MKQRILYVLLLLLCLVQASCVKEDILSEQPQEQPRERSRAQGSARSSPQAPEPERESEREWAVQQSAAEHHNAR